MSSGNRIKKFYQKNNGTSGFTPYPLGADGQFIDMFSGLDLEEEQLLGGNHDVTFSKGTRDYEIIERYYNKPISTGDTLVTPIVQYTVRTQLINSVILTLYTDESDNASIITTDGDTNLVAEEDEEDEYDIIISQLYKGDYYEEEIEDLYENNLLHTKYIVVYFKDGSYRVKQQLDNPVFQDLDITLGVD